MEQLVDAVFCQDLGINGAEKKRYVDLILDYIVRPEFEKISGIQSTEDWCVVRLDDNGNEFIVKSGLSFETATSLAREFESKGHKQTYWVKRG